jgi:hypothetical protein
MNATEKFIAADAHVDAAAIASLPNSRKIYVTGSQPDLRVPMREISRATRRPIWVARKTHRFTFTIAPARTPILRQKLIFVLA